ncbi:MAG: hypothetical protein HC865_08705 [Cyanobacteria bacterium RU_5_0]|nr:hypothetical protein [Cyanobacteria bacterium RU_5_0]
MVRAMERIEQEITVLEQSVAVIIQEFHHTYHQYLIALGQAVRQQLILATYHICTHAYPERFLTLSLDQRQRLQRSLQQLAKHAQNQLIEQLQPIHSSHTSNSFLPSAESLATFDVDDDMDDEADDDMVDEADDEADDDMVDEADDEADDDTVEDRGGSPVADSKVDHLEEASDSEESTIAPDENESLAESPPTLKDLVHWQEHLEEDIVEVLQDLSHATNCLLQQADILPGRLPEPVLEVAAKADLASETTVSPPNLLNLLVETENEEDKESTMTQVMAVRLRLSEIEFSDSSTTVWRSKIRSLSAQLNKLGRDYQKKCKERAIVQAETAWRSSWFEE